MTADFPVLAVLRHRPYARFALCRFFTTLSWQMFGVAMGWHIYAVTRDALALGLVGLCAFLPFVCLVLVGGHVADQVERWRVLAFAWGIETACIGALVWLVASGIRQVWPIYLTTAIFGATRAFWAPSMQALVPSLVPRAEFPRALAMNSALFQGAVICGPALGGVLYLVNPLIVFVACLVLIMATVPLGLSLRPPNVVPAVAAQAAEKAQEVAVGGSRGHVFLEGLRYVLHQRLILGVISLDLFAVLFGGATALLPIFASDVLHVGPAGLGLLRSAPGVGAALMAGVLTMRPIEHRAGLVMFGGVALFGLCTLLFGDSYNFGLSLAALFLLGAGDMLSVYVRGIVVQLQTPDAIRGRVSAINSMFSGASNELGEFESGVTAHWFGAVRATLLGGLLTLAVVGGWLGLFPQLRRLDRLR